MRPMLATPGELPVGPGWAYEVKWDGVRALCTVRDGAVRLASRNGADLTAAFPEIGAAPGVDALVDGELVAFDGDVPRFGALVGRLHVATAGRAAAGSRGRPATLVGFDLLRLGGTDLTGRSYLDRRAALVSLGLDATPGWRVPEAFDDGPGLLAATRDRGLEGVVAKRRDSTYHPGVRSRDWVKVPHRRSHSFVIGGWKPGQGAAAHRVGALVVGSPTGGDRLVLDGAVGSGIGEAVQRALRPVLEDLAADRSPFDGAEAALPSTAAGPPRWVEPVLVVDVAHLGRTSAGLLRQPSLVRLRPDRSYDDLLATEQA